MYIYQSCIPNWAFLVRPLKQASVEDTVHDLITKTEKSPNQLAGMLTVRAMRPEDKSDLNRRERKSTGQYSCRII